MLTVLVIQNGDRLVLNSICRGVPEGFFATGSGKNGPKSGFTGSGSELLASPTMVNFDGASAIPIFNSFS